VTGCMQEEMNSGVLGSFEVPNWNGEVEPCCKFGSLKDGYILTIYISTIGFWYYPSPYIYLKRRYGERTPISTSSKSLLRPNQQR
jgi:hypothetical protein